MGEFWGKAADDGGEKEKLIPLLLTLFLLPHRVRCETHNRNQKQQERKTTHPHLPRLVFTNLQTNDDEKEEPELVFDDEIPKCLHGFSLLGLEPG